MAALKPAPGDDVPALLVNSPTGEFARNNAPALVGDGSKLQRRRLHRNSRSEGQAKHIRVEAPTKPLSSARSIYTGSYTQSPRRSRTSLGSIGDRQNFGATSSPRPSLNHDHLDVLLQDLNLDLETYGVEELRDGFFDASFFKPSRVDRENLLREAEYTLPDALMKKHPLSPGNFIPKQWHGIKSVTRSLATTRSGIKLLKSFLGFFIAYILCLIPTVSTWLGRYNYIMVLSTVFNHPGRTIGAQLDGALLTIAGTATGLGWGAFALYVSDSTGVAEKGYGGILAAFLVPFMAIIAALRSYYIRLYQFVLCAGIAFIYTVLADASQDIHWHKLFNYGIPWLFGQAICLLICLTVFPDAGARPLAVSLHAAFGIMGDGLQLPQPNSSALHRQLAWTFVNLSQAHRDLVLDVSITRFKPNDIMILRNLMQAVIRSLLSLKMETEMFDDTSSKSSKSSSENEKEAQDHSSFDTGTRATDGRTNPCSKSISLSQNNFVIDIDGPRLPPITRTSSEKRAVKLVVSKLAEPTSELLSLMRASLLRCDAVLMGMSGYRRYLGPPESVSSDILGVLTKIRKAMIKYDEEEDSLLNHPDLPPSYSNHPEVVNLFLFVHPIRQAAGETEKLLVKVNEMQQRHPGWRLYLPSYSFGKALQRTNAQVRHDRGGVTAGFYFRSQAQLAKMMRGMSNVYKPLPHKQDVDSMGPKPGILRADTLGKYEEEEEVAMNQNSKALREKKIRHKLWRILHRAQGFELRFALKVSIVTALLSIPAWLPHSRGWWNAGESWWAVVTVWIMMHPRVGGNIQDLFTRALCGILGAVFGGIAYGADNGNPYVMAFFAFLYMAPMMYRFTQSSHPRSGLVGCVAFVVVSLSTKTANGIPSVVELAWTRGVAFVVGIVSAIIVNWVLWPFVARHELRKALSAMLIYSSVIYRGVVAKYVYYEDGDEPGDEDIERSEMLEGRLREGFVRIRQLLALTRHEIRLRGPFNHLPYSALMDASERFFEYLVALRQSSVFFHPHYISDDEQAAESLLPYRRDAVATILMNLYVLAGALRGNRKVPRYLPSAAAARKRLLDHMAELEMQEAQSTTQNGKAKLGEARKWAQIYSYAYNQSLTGCVTQLEQLQRYTKEIVGEQGFDPVSFSAYEDLTGENVKDQG